MAETAVTKSAALALADERSLMRQGYQFLDEKRMLVAAELLRTLARHQAAEAALIDQVEGAAAALRAALQRHGLRGLTVYPPVAAPPGAPAFERRLFLGVPLLQATPGPPGSAPADEALDASPEALACGQAFQRLLPPLIALAAAAGDAARLAAEYRRTERRARALENVLLPEIEAALKTIDEQLALADQEEAVRVRQAATSSRRAP